MRNNEVERIVKQSENRFQGVVKRRIQRIAEQLNFNIATDVFLPENTGLILENSIACIVCLILIGELSDRDHNCIRKCLTAGHNRIVICTNEVKGIEDIRKLCLLEVSSEDHHKIIVLNPERLAKYLKQFKVDSTTTEVVNGWKINVEFIEMSKDESERRVNSVIRVLANAKICNE